MGKGYTHNFQIGGHDAAFLQLDGGSVMKKYNEAATPK
jgi:hypothetical protein